MPEQGERLPLDSWRKGENPFQDDECFEGFQTGWNDKGQWWFTIRPSSPFRHILAEVERLNRGFGFVRKKELVGPRLADVVTKTTKTVFCSGTSTMT